MRTATGVFLGHEIWLAFGMAIVGLWTLFGTTAYSSSQFPIPPAPKCLSLASEPQLSYRPEGWVLDFDLLVTGTLPSILPAVPITPTVTGSWTLDPLKVLTQTYSAPSALRLIFDIDGSMLTPTNGEHVAREEQFWNHTLPQIIGGGKESSSLWSSLNVYSPFECGATSIGLNWYTNDLQMTPDLIRSQVSEAFECASNKGSSPSSSFPYSPTLGGPPQSPPRTWIAIRWLSSDNQFLSETDPQNNFGRVIKYRYNNLRASTADQLIILLLQRTYGAPPRELEERERLRQKAEQIDPARPGVYILSVDKSIDDPSLIDELNRIKDRLAQRNVVHLSVLVDRLLTSDQVRSARLLVDYRASSSQCDFVATVPLPSSWSGEENPSPPFPLDWLRLFVASCLVVSLAVASSLFLFGRHQWFRKGLRKTEWESKWDSPGR